MRCFSVIQFCYQQIGVLKVLYRIFIVDKSGTSSLSRTKINSKDMSKQFFLALCLALNCFLCGAQSYYFQNYQVDDGLLHNSVTAIIQDHKGFIWVGTKGGLNRFDGCDFKDFSTVEKRSGENSITSLREDQNGRLWVGTLNGLFYLNGRSETVLRAKVPFRPVNAITCDAQNRLWLVSNGKISTYQPTSGKYFETAIGASVLEFDKQGTLWIGTGNGALKALKVTDKELNAGRIKLHLKASLNWPITKLLPIDDYILIATTHGFYKYCKTTGKVKALLTNDADGRNVFVRDIKISSNGNCWLATERGIYIYDLKNNSYKNIRKEVGNYYSLSDNAVYALFQDKRNGIWAGTFFGGLNHLSTENNVFEKYFPINSVNSISGSAVREICGDDQDNVWIGTEDAGINRFDPKSKLFYHFSSGKLPSELSYPNIHGLLVNKDEVLAGPFLQGLEILDRQTGKVIKRFSNFRHPEAPSKAFVISIAKTSTAKILIGTTGAGLLYYTPKAKNLVPVPQIPPRSFVYAVAEDQAGTIWTGSLGNGAFFYNPKKGEYGNVRFRNKENPSKTEDLIQGIYEDSRKALWFATEGGGLIRLNQDHKTFKRFDTKTGFPTNNTFRILEDSHHNLWISSLKGLICFNLDTEKFNVYSKSNGLLTDQFNYNSAYKDKGGKMYFGSVKGLISFHPDSLKKKTPVPPIYVTAIHISENSTMEKPEVLKRSMITTDSIALEYNQSSFDIEFAALDYSAPDMIRYSYRLEGLNNQWTEISTNRKAYFTNLAPGEYKFAVQARSNIGLWKTPVRMLYIKITPPYWKSTAAYIFYAIFLCSVICLAIYSYHRSIKIKNERVQQLFALKKEKETYHAKIEFFTNIAHEIQTPLTLVKGPIDWALNKIDDAPTVRRNLELVKKNIHRLITLTTQLLDFRKTEEYHFSLNFELINISKLLADLLEVFSSQIAERDLKLEVNMPKEPILAIVDKEAVTTIISNLISNAIKYSDTRVAIMLNAGADKQKQDFTLRIENDGEVIDGIHKEKIFEPFYRVEKQNNIPGSGIGLALAKQLAQLHNGQLILIVHNEINIFELSLPNNQKIKFELEELKV